MLRHVQSLGAELRLCRERTLSARFGDLRVVRLGQGTTATSWDHQEEVEAPVRGSKMSWGEGRNYRAQASCLHKGWLRASRVDLEMQVPQRYLPELFC